MADIGPVIRIHPADNAVIARQQLLGGPPLPPTASLSADWCLPLRTCALISSEGSRNATTEDFTTVLDAMRAGLIPQTINTHRLALSDVPTRFQDLLDPKAGVIRAIVEC